MRRRRRYPLPRLLMPSKVVRPPVECSRGTSPSQAAISRALRNCCPSPAAAIRAVAPSARFGHGHQAPCSIVLSGNRFDLLGHISDALFDVLQIFEEPGEGDASLR